MSKIKTEQPLLPFDEELFKQQLADIDEHGTSEEYRRFMSSHKWRELRLQAFVRSRFTCERCGVVKKELHINPMGHIYWSGPPLQLHHVTYDRFGGNELLSDLRVLCIDCHKIEDSERKTSMVEQAWELRVDGYARRVYGVNWESRVDFDYVAAEFMQWLDQKGYDN